MQVEPQRHTSFRRGAYGSRTGVWSRLGGPAGNSRLTATTASVLLILLAVECATLVSLQTFLSWHIFVGMLLVPVVLLKIGTTGYRFLRFYAKHHEYVSAGPPPALLRLLGPIVVVSSTGLFATGVALAALGPGTRLVLPLHKASFIVWVGAMSLHVLGHVTKLPRLAAADVRGPRVEGSRTRAVLLAGAIVVGAILAVATVPWIAPWAHAMRFDG
ncbi:MAG: hypothetical protein H0X39_02515 [Actinobacteria bacterium]|nr:hypothetical protein [Actinomycetota bacterium]